MNGTMNRNINRNMQEMMSMMNASTNTVTAQSSACEAGEPALVAENCHVSNFSLAAFAASVLLTLGIIVYALLTV